MPFLNTHIDLLLDGLVLPNEGNATDPIQGRKAMTQSGLPARRFTHFDSHETLTPLNGKSHPPE